MDELDTALGIDAGEAGVTLSGELDAHTAPELDRVLARLLRSSPSELIVHMGAVTFMDSSGLQTLLAATRTAREAGGELVLAAPTPAVRRLIELTGLDGHLTMRDATG